MDEALKSIEEYILLTDKAIKDYSEGKLIKKEDTWTLTITRPIFDCWNKKEGKPEQRRTEQGGEMTNLTNTFIKEARTILTKEEKKLKDLYKKFKKTDYKNNG